MPRRRVRLGLAPLAPLLVLTLLAGCRTARQVAARYPSSDIEAIYAGALPNPERNPVVLIHGFAGAALRRVDDGAAVWGTFFTKDSLLPSSQEGLAAFALDIGGMQPPISAAQLGYIEDDTLAVALLEKVKADAGVMDVNVGIYSALVELMEESGYGDCVADPSAITQRALPPCLTFFYDWRQDNVGNAIRLGRFLEQARSHLSTLPGEAIDDTSEEIRFDLIAHSMGGLVSRYFLRYGTRDVLGDPQARIDWAGAELVDRLVLISTPNFGAARVLKEMVTGRRYPLVKFEPAMIATWVSAYQMLPRPEQKVWLDPEGEPVEVDLLSAQTWLENGWGPFAVSQDRFLAWIYPGEASPAIRRGNMASFMDAALTRARQFFDAMDRPADRPCPSELILFAADVQPTMARVAVVPKRDRQVLRFEDFGGLSLKAPGDGSVTRASAVADERLFGGASGFVSSPVPWNQQIFLTDMHMTFLGNPTFQNNLLHILLEEPPSRARSWE